MGLTARQPPPLPKHMQITRNTHTRKCPHADHTQYTQGNVHMQITLNTHTRKCPHANHTQYTHKDSSTCTPRTFHATSTKLGNCDSRFFSLHCKLTLQTRYVCIGIGCRSPSRPEVWQVRNFISHTGLGHDRGCA